MSVAINGNCNTTVSQISVIDCNTYLQTLDTPVIERYVLADSASSENQPIHPELEPSWSPSINLPSWEFDCLSIVDGGRLNAGW